VILAIQAPAGGTVGTSSKQVETFRPARSASPSEGRSRDRAAGLHLATPGATITAGTARQARSCADTGSYPAPPRAKPEATSHRRPGPAPAAGPDRLWRELRPRNIPPGPELPQGVATGACLGGPGLVAQHPPAAPAEIGRQGEGGRAGARHGRADRLHGEGPVSPAGYCGGSTRQLAESPRPQQRPLGGPWRAQAAPCASGGARPVFRPGAGWRQLRGMAAQPVAHR